MSAYWQHVAMATAFLGMVGSVFTFSSGVAVVTVDGHWWGWVLLLASPAVFILTISYLLTFGGAA